MVLAQSILIALAGLINFAPVLGVFSRKRLETLYGVEFSDPNLIIMMRHRAVLFGLIGGFMIYAAFVPHLLMLAIAMGLVSMIAYIALCIGVGGYNAALRRVIIADIIGIGLLIVALGLRISA